MCIEMQWKYKKKMKKKDKSVWREKKLIQQQQKKTCKASLLPDYLKSKRKKEIKIKK